VAIRRGSLWKVIPAGSARAKRLGASKFCFGTARVVRKACSGVCPGGKKKDTATSNGFKRYFPQLSTASVLLGGLGSKWVWGKIGPFQNSSGLAENSTTERQNGGGGGMLSQRSRPTAQVGWGGRRGGAGKAVLN